jgi:hypothetical protein
MSFNERTRAKSAFKLSRRAVAVVNVIPPLRREVELQGERRERTTTSLPPTPEFPRSPRDLVRGRALGQIEQFSQEQFSQIDELGIIPYR